MPPSRKERSWHGERMAQVGVVGRQQKLQPVQRKQQKTGELSPARGRAVLSGRAARPGTAQGWVFRAAPGRVTQR